MKTNPNGSDNSRIILPLVEEDRKENRKKPKLVARGLPRRGWGVHAPSKS